MESEKLTLAGNERLSEELRAACVQLMALSEALTHVRDSLGRQRREEFILYEGAEDPRRGTRLATVEKVVAPAMDCLGPAQPLKQEVLIPVVATLTSAAASPQANADHEDVARQDEPAAKALKDAALATAVQQAQEEARVEVIAPGANPGNVTAARRKAARKAQIKLTLTVAEAAALEIAKHQRLQVMQGMVHSQLPDTLERHPHTGQRNCHEQGQVMECGVGKLLDRRGESPHRSYLVEWKTTPLELSWVWAENLAGVPDLMGEIDLWKDSGSILPFKHYARAHFKGPTSAPSALAFLEACQSACYFLGSPSTITSEHWTTFAAVSKRELSSSVSRKEASLFFEHLQRCRVPLNDDVGGNMLTGAGSKRVTFGRRIEISTTLPGTGIPGKRKSKAQKTRAHCRVVNARNRQLGGGDAAIVGTPIARALALLPRTDLGILSCWESRASTW